MAELALYRKYRSATLAEVVAQPQVVQTLTNALAAGRTGHAYLFTGPKGVGKTSVARILARSLNCTGPDPKPCNQCLNCLAALNGNLDIIEIDAASNRGIDEIRDLKEKIVLAPSLGAYKVYIIDEVHMLTDPAFNALLKTLEEPPAHAVFIMATTEAHKLPLTIVSRTQRFSFRAIEQPVIAGHLKMVAGKENITIDDEAASMIAAAAGGSFRDGLSLLDQLAAGGEAITADSVRQLLGWGSAAEVEALYRMITEDDLNGALAQLDSLYERGAHSSQLINQLVQLVRTDLRSRLESRASTDQALRLLADLTGAPKAALPRYALEIAIARYRQQPILPADKPAVRPAAVEPVASSVSAPAQPASEPSIKPISTTSAPAPAAKTTPASSDNDSFDIRWMKALAEIKAHNNSLYALLCSCDASQTDDGIQLVTRFNFHRDRLMEVKNLNLIKAASRKALGADLAITAVVQSATPPAAVEADTELVSSALEILGGEVVE